MSLTVSFPERVNPGEVLEAWNYIRILFQSTGQVREGIVVGRGVVNVRGNGGNKVEFNGVSQKLLMLELTKIETFSQ